MAYCLPLCRKLNGFKLKGTRKRPFKQYFVSFLTKIESEKQIEITNLKKSPLKQVKKKIVVTIKLIFSAVALSVSNIFNEMHCLFDFLVIIAGKH